MPEYRNPKPTTDVIVEVKGGIVLIERRDEPKGFAIPGGFVNEGEPVELAAIREMKEEIGIDVVLTDLLYVYSDPSRDPRHHTLTTVFVGRPRNRKDVPKAGDDAKALRVVDPAKPPKLAFDHAKILEDYTAWKKGRGKRPDPMKKLSSYR
jgi:8-oxo-dGTP diphosphatase